MKIIRVFAFAGVLAAAGCAGIVLPPIGVVFEQPAVKPPAAPPVAAVPAPVVAEPAPAVVEPVAPELPPLANLNIVVHDASTGAGIGRAVCDVNGESRTADGSGFINFAVRGSSPTLCRADGYQARAAVDLPAGDHRVALTAIPVPVAVKPPTPKLGTTSNLGFEGCGAKDNTLNISDGCLEAVARVSLNYPLCKSGDPVACHRYVREVALALRTTQNDPAWGLLSKPRGQQSCSLTECGGGVGGYGEDMVTYLPKGNPVNLWTGLDIIIGAGAPGSHYGGGKLPAAVGGRADNLWAPIPK